MTTRTWIGALLAAAAALFAANASAQLYAATGSNGVSGNLFTVDPATAATTLVGPIVVAALPVSITGLAVHPVTGVLYGAVAGGSPNFGSNLITINTATGAGTLLGPFGTVISDIAFNAAGVLYGWDRNTNRLATINIATGTATDLGASGLLPFQNGGGLSINAAGTGFVTMRTAAGTLDSVNTATGAGVTGPALTGAPIAGAINALAFSPAGVLFGVDSDQSGSPTANNLVTINTATGAVTSIGALPGDTDALAFVVLAAPGVIAQVPTLNEWALIFLALLLAAAGASTLRRRGA